MRKLLAVLLVAACAGENAELTSTAHEMSSAGEYDDGRGDRDRDGVIDRDDTCPDSVFVSERHPTAVRGCSPTDLMADPWPLWSDPRAKAEALISELGDDSSTEAARGAIESAITAGDLALDDISRADNCAAADRLAGAAAALDSAARNLAVEIADRARHAADAAAGLDDDTTPEATELVGWQRRAARLGELEAAVGRIGSDYRQLCAGAEPAGSIRGEVAAYDSASRVMELTDGTVFAVPDAQIETTIGLGSDVAVQMMKTGGGLWSSGIQPETPGVIAEQLLIHKSKCLKLRFVPNQMPVGNSMLGRLDPAGYADHGYGYWLEKGMRLSADDSECPQGGIGITDSFGFKLTLKYYRNGIGWTTKILAHDLTSTTTPIKFPADMNTILPGTLTAERYHTSCNWNGTPLPSTCTAPAKVSGETYPIYVLERNYYCAIDYSKTLFTLEDDDFTSHQVTAMSGFSLHFANADPSAPLGISALALPILGNGFAPAPEPIHANQPFAIRNVDFYPVWPTQGPPNPVWTGMNQPSGVMWPHVVGKRNGAWFSYSCRVPELTRDAIADCGSVPHCLYRMPFDAMHTTHVSQGNFGAVSHNGAQSYAYDLVSPAGTSIRAARGGVVTQVVDGITANCTGWLDKTNCPWFGNFVAIRHQDGTVGFYVHMSNGSPAVTMGAVVKRGDHLGQVGNTGNSTGPHLHMHVINTSTGWTIPIRFELIMQGTGNVEVCQNPGAGWYPTSTNNLW